MEAPRSRYQRWLDGRAVGRILRFRNFGRQRSALEGLPVHPNGGGRTVQIRVGAGDLGIDLTQRRHVIEYPERSAVRRYHQIVAVNYEIADRYGWKIELQRLPVVAVVEGDEHAGFGAGLEQSFANRAFTNGVQKRRRFDTSCDGCPGLSVIACAVEIRLVVVQSMAVHCGTGHSGGEVRGFDGCDFAPVSDAGGRDIGPGLAAIARKMYLAGVASYPDQTGFDGRWRNGIDPAVPAGFGIFDGQVGAWRGLSASCVNLALFRVSIV